MSCICFTGFSIDEVGGDSILISDAETVAIHFDPSSTFLITSEDPKSQCCSFSETPKCWDINEKGASRMPDEPILHLLSVLLINLAVLLGDALLTRFDHP